jgi:hypothetical protein
MSQKGEIVFVERPSAHLQGQPKKKVPKLDLWSRRMSQNQARIASRSKRIDGVVHEPGVVVLSHSNLEIYFSSPLHVAAKDLGVCTTALKRYYFHAYLNI